MNPFRADETIAVHTQGDRDWPVPAVGSHRPRRVVPFLFVWSAHWCRGRAGGLGQSPNCLAVHREGEAVQLTAVFVEVPTGYIAYVEELPGANTQGDTLEEARENLQEAVALVLEANRELATRL